MTEHCPIETERKYLARIPSLPQLRAMPEHTESDIEQVYLAAPEGQTHRIRRRRYADRTVCTETVKTRLNALQAYEEEHEITEREFEKKCLDRDPTRHIICKKRHTFVYKKQVFEVDIYPFWEQQCVVETELSDPSEQAEFPPLLTVLREVSADRSYSNAALSRRIPAEDTAR